ncbi:unnamed protein product [marine sediment metagenome]|uniref:Uncharacterized protein n=1 Tax=marine sediment metagenome TaxID=412755 RepID=X0XX41_9ZZZZ
MNSNQQFNVPFLQGLLGIHGPVGGGYGSSAGKVGPIAFRPVHTQGATAYCPMFIGSGVLAEMTVSFTVIGRAKVLAAA